MEVRTAVAQMAVVDAPRCVDVRHFDQCRYPQDEGRHFARTSALFMSFVHRIRLRQLFSHESRAIVAQG